MGDGRHEHEGQGGPILRVAGLSVSYGRDPVPLRAVRDVGFAIRPGEAYGLIGESGSGKSTVAYAIMGYLVGGRVVAGDIEFQGRSLLHMSGRDLSNLRGRDLAMVYQDPMTALNPSIRVGEQIAEVLRRHQGLGRRRAWEQAVELLAQVHLGGAAAIARRYPHQLSGGQQQRAVIAMALSCRPRVLIMDEPTTGLDVTTEAVILDLVAELRREFGLALLFISHNLGVVSKVCDRIAVLYAGQLVEEGTTADVLRAPRHPYTVELLRALPRLRGEGGRLRSIPGTIPDLHAVPSGCIFASRCPLVRDECRTEMPDLAAVGPGHTSRCHFWREVRATARGAEGTGAAAPGGPGEPVLEAHGVRKRFRGSGALAFFGGSAVRALDGVSLTLQPGETIGVVGESGCGKSTLARCLVGLTAPNEGTIRFQSRELAGTAQRRSRSAQQLLQIIFQNPDAALNPRHTVADIVSRPLSLYRLLRRSQLRRRTAELLEAVKLDDRYARRYPAELSGGEKQRVAIARAFAAEPRVVVCDEPTSALDVSVQAAVLNNLLELQERYTTSYVFISHDLGVVRYMAHRVAIMYLGLVIEAGATHEVFAPPHHPYTEALLSSVPTVEAEELIAPIRLHGPVPLPAGQLRGCPFESRCPRKLGRICEEETPPLQAVADGHAYACHIPPGELAAAQHI